MPLVALDKSWAICMPKKTASQSLVGMLNAKQEGGDGVSIAEVEGEWHGCNWDGIGERLMIVREPKERLTSMYWFSLKEQTFCHGEGGPDAWLCRFARCVSSGKSGDLEWTLTQSEMANRFKPTVVFRLEDGLQKVLDYLEVNVAIQYRNVTKGKRNERKSFYETFTCIPSSIAAWLKSDSGDWY